MDRYGPPSQMRAAPVPPMRVSSLASASRTASSNGGQSSETSSLRSGRSGMSFESGHRTSQESTKPRLSKDQQEYLERRFAEQQKPNTQTKKQFADSLGVPLEKINNWFQNRRAKSKQDAKKKQTAYAQFVPPYPIVNGHHHPLGESYIDQSFYHHTAHPQHGYLAGWQQPVLPGNSIDPGINPNSMHFNFDLDPSTYIPSHGVPDHLMNSGMGTDDLTPKAFETFFGLADPSHPAESHAMNIYRGQFCNQEGFGPAMDTIPEYDIPDSAVSASHLHSSNGDNALSRQNTISSEELSNSIPYPPRSGDLPMAPTADFFHPIDSQNDMYILPTWGQSAGRPLDMGDTQMQEISTPHGESELPYRTVAHPYSSEPHSQAYQSSTPGASFSDRIQHRDHHDSDKTLTEDSHATAIKNIDDSSLPPSTMAQRRDSTMTRLVESIDNVHVQPHALEKKPSQQSIGHPSLASSLASRRQRRPAPLGMPGARSTSISSTTPASPKAAQPHSSERELRRIKSSIGVMNGRVQKAGLTNTAQRSPASFTFSEAAASARASKSLSSRSMTSLTRDSLSRTNSLVPATPVSPPADDMASIQFGGLDKAQRMFSRVSSSQDDSVWANMPNTSDTTTESVWSSFVPQHPDTWINFNSPPDTPLQQHLLSESSSQSQVNQNSMETASDLLVPSFTHAFLPGAFGMAYHGQGPPTVGPPYTHDNDMHGAEDSSVQEFQQFRRDSQSMLEGLNHSRPNGATEIYKQGFESHNSKMQEQAANAADEQAQAQSHRQSPGQSQIATSRSRSEAASVTPQPTQQALQLSQRGDQSRQSGLHMFHVSDPDLRNLEPGQVPLSLTQAATTPPRTAQELVIHEFSPRDPVPTERMPPRTRPAEQPKSFEFQMCGPENFSSP